MDGVELNSSCSDPKDLLKKFQLILQNPVLLKHHHRGDSPESSSCSVNFRPCCVDLNISLAEDHQDFVSDDSPHSNLPPDGNNWDVGNKGSSNAAEPQASPNTSFRVPSLVNTQHSFDVTPRATMSATTILQHAAIIGSTRAPQHRFDSIRVPSLLSTQHSFDVTPRATMSATAILQHAAVIGSTRAPQHRFDSIRVPSLLSTQHYSDQTPCAMISATTLLQQAVIIGSTRTLQPLFDVKSHIESSNTSIRVPSLISRQCYYDQTPHATMSASALLQDAARMGLKESSLPRFEMKSHEHRMENADISCGLYGTNTSVFAMGRRSDVLGSVPNQLQVQPFKRRRIIQSEERVTAGSGETKDFLGVGTQPISLPISIDEWI